MNIIINKPQLVRAVLLYLNKNFGNLTQKTSSEYPNSVFYVDSDNRTLFIYTKEKNSVLFLDKIWLKIESLFLLTYDEVQSIIKYWLEKTYNLKNATPRKFLPFLSMDLD